MLTVKKITSYDGSNNPVFGESTNIDISSNNYEYSFDASEYSSNNMVGVYVDATFKKKTYQITFVVGANGEIKTLTDGNIASPVTVEYNDDYSLKVIANEGYEVDEILINGIKYNLNNGVLIIPNVVANTNVNITFKLKSDTIKVNDTEYTFSHGTTYEQMLQGLNLAKPGYKFLYLTDNSGSKITESYIVTKNDNLTAIYQKIEEQNTPSANKNPSTGNKNNLNENIKKVNYEFVLNSFPIDKKKILNNINANNNLSKMNNKPLSINIINNTCIYIKPKQLKYGIKKQSRNERTQSDMMPINYTQRTIIRKKKPILKFAK